MELVVSDTHDTGNTSVGHNSFAVIMTSLEIIAISRVLF